MMHYGRQNGFTALGEAIAVVMEKALCAFGLHAKFEVVGQHPHRYQRCKRCKQRL